MKTEKRKRGPAPLAPAVKRSHRITVFVRDQELDKLADRAGGTEWIPSFLRAAALGKSAPRRIVVPPLNREVWADFARTAGNLNQIAHRLNLVEKGAELAPKIEEVSQALAEFRRRLLGQNLFMPSLYDSEDVDESQN
ncbi:MAG: MobC family plasmid mobilization relaxosome protein [Proteobacteria bacterium]|nr:MobC family plasmid mobilization relaxosome protein [Pseudomonadota bacterium]MBU4413458.1 MobC family plasmid mobilization relaxosome protein [Pseudomonadota bacterium]MCG2822131.1 MobC family plasmid mobilization relaxosome protein [Desulfobulbaceae bacterium]